MSNLRLPLKIGWRHDAPLITTAFVLAPLRQWEEITRNGETPTDQIQRLALVARCVASEAQQLAITLDARAREQHAEEHPSREMPA